VPSSFGKGNGGCGFCHLIYPFKKSTITSETDLPSDFAFAFAFAHTWSLTRTDLIFFPTITTPHIRSLNPNTNQETLHWVHQFQPTTDSLQLAKSQ
jgi:hypothetical protein